MIANEDGLFDGWQKCTEEMSLKNFACLLAYYDFRSQLSQKLQLARKACGRHANDVSLLQTTVLNFVAYRYGCQYKVGQRPTDTKAAQLMGMADDLRIRSRSSFASWCPER